MKQSDCKNRFPVFKERLEELKGGMSVTEYAAFLGLTRQTVGFYLNGERIPDILGLKQIAEKCEVSADWLLGLSNERSRDANVTQICNSIGLNSDAVCALMEDVSLRDRFGYPRIMLLFLNELLCGRRNINASSYARCAAVTSIQWNKFLERRRQLFDAGQLDNASSWSVLDFGSVENFEEGMIRVPVGEVRDLYKHKYLSCVESAAKLALREYVGWFQSNDNHYRDFDGMHFKPVDLPPEVDE